MSELGGALASFAANVAFWVRVVFRAVFCSAMILLWLVGYFGLVAPIYPLKYIWPRLWWGIEGKLYRWLMACVGYWGYTAGYDVIEYGEDLSACVEDRCLVICNHQSTADVPVLMAALTTKGTCSRKTMWIMAGMFKWSPFGLIAQVHGDHFVWEGKNIREAEMQRLQKRLHKNYWSRDRWWVMLFPEGGFLYKRRETSKAYGAKNGFPVLENATLPRVGAFRGILQAIGPRADFDVDQATSVSRAESFSSAHDADTHLRPTAASSSDASHRATAPRERSRSRARSDGGSPRPSKMQMVADTVGAIRSKKYVRDTRPPIKYVIDATIGFQNGEALSADQLWFGSRKYVEDIHVYYKVYKADSVPFDDEDKCRDWLYARYAEKDAMLQHFYDTGEMVAGEYGHRIHFPLWKIVLQHSFWMALAFANVHAYSALASRVWTALVSIAPI